MPFDDYDEWDYSQYREDEFHNDLADYYADQEFDRRREDARFDEYESLIDGDNPGPMYDPD